jgi:hypothetical protein
MGTRGNRDYKYIGGRPSPVVEYAARAGVAQTMPGTPRSGRYLFLAVHTDMADVIAVKPLVSLSSVFASIPQQWPFS